MYVIDPNSDEPIMMLDQQIGIDPETGKGIDGAMFAQELLSLDGQGKKSIQIYINCPGGSVMDGMNIYNAIIKSKTPVDTHDVGIAASMGGVCFLAGRKRIISDYATLMIHNPSGAEDKKESNALIDSLATMLSAKSGVSKEEVVNLMDKTTWLNSAECFAKGFATEIAVTAEANKKGMPKNDAKRMWEFSNNILNNINNMKNVTNKLNLNEGSSEDFIVKAIESIQNKAKEAEDKAKASDAKAKAAEDALAAANKELEDAKAKAKAAKEAYDKLKADTEDKLKADTEDKAEKMVTNYAKIGRIKNDATVIAKWKTLAVNDYAGTETLIKDLPLNKSASIVKLEAVDSEAALKYAGTAAAKMLEITNRNKK